MDGIKKLVAYALRTNLIESADIIYAVNSLLIEMHQDSAEFEVSEIEKMAADIDGAAIDSGAYLEAVLKELDDCAAANGLLENDSVVYRDLFDTRLMGVLTDRPGNVIKKFQEK